MKVAGNILVILLVSVVFILGYRDNARMRKELLKQPEGDVNQQERGRFKLSSDAKGKTLKIDTKTGEIWQVSRYGERSLTNPPARTAPAVTAPAVQEPQSGPLPDSALDQINATMERGRHEEIGFLRVHLHNGTNDWTIDSFVIRVEGPDWSRRYKKEFTYDPLEPLASDRYNIRCGGIDPATIMSFTLESATGISSKPLQTAQDPSRDVSRY